MKAPTSVHTVKVKGILRAIDLARRSCQIVRTRGGSVHCVFDEQQEEAARKALGQVIVATGRASRREVDGAIKRLVIYDIAVVGGVPSGVRSRIRRKPLTARALLESGLVGLWRSRTDIGDSSEFAHSLRERAQRSRGN